MTHAFADIAFTPAVRAAQSRDGSRDLYARHAAAGEDVLGPREAAFIADQRSFTMATVSETGWPYVQHRGGPKGFLKVLDERTIGFADYAGNRQFVSVGNLAGSDRVALILIDYTRHQRLKILGHATLRDLAVYDPQRATLVDPGYRARPQRAVTIRIAAFDWNCPQHLPTRFDAEDVARAIEERDARIAALEARLAEAGNAAGV